MGPLFDQNAPLLHNGLTIYYPFIRGSNLLDVMVIVIKLQTVLQRIQIMTAPSIKAKRFIIFSPEATVLDLLSLHFNQKRLKTSSSSARVSFD